MGIKGGNVVSIESTPEPSNTEIIKKLTQIDNHIEKVEKRVKDIYGWMLGIFFGGLIGFFWDDIFNFFKGLFD
jgi:hypothetical protein